MDKNPENKERKEDLIRAYDRMAQLRDFDRYEEWKRRERRDFASRLMGEGKTHLLDIGCGTGRDTLWFSENGFRVTGIDFSPRMIDLCRKKGLNALVMDFLEPELKPGTFEGIYALNALVHVGSAEYPRAMKTLKDLLVPGGLFYLGQYGGSDFEGVLDHDNYRPRRYFHFPSEDNLRKWIDPDFLCESWKVIPLEGRDYVFYSGVLRAKGANAD